MTDSVRIQGPVEIKGDSRERVAFDLMEKINKYNADTNIAKNEAYFFNLYRQCLRVVEGKIPE